MLIGFFVLFLCLGLLVAWYWEARSAALYLSSVTSALGWTRKSTRRTAILRQTNLEKENAIHLILGA